MICTLPSPSWVPPAAKALPPRPLSASFGSLRKQPESPAVIVRHATAAANRLRSPGSIRDLPPERARDRPLREWSGSPGGSLSSRLVEPCPPPAATNRQGRG